MMLPILISVSLAPGSYFFCAPAGSAVHTKAANRSGANRRQIAIFPSPIADAAASPTSRAGMIDETTGALYSFSPGLGHFGPPFCTFAEKEGPAGRAIPVHAPRGACQ